MIGSNDKEVSLLNTLGKLPPPSHGRHSWPRCPQFWQSSPWGDSNFFASSSQTGASLRCPGC